MGLDPTSVEVLGLLPPHALLETGFVVTPVLAWSVEPIFDLPANRGEVAAVQWLALRRRAQTAEDFGGAVELCARTRSVLTRLAGQLPSTAADAEPETLPTPGVDLAALADPV